jgi:integrase
MPTIKLTQPAVERLKPPARGRIEYWDSQLPGFGIRISESGRKTWVAPYRVSGKLVRETLGTVAIFPNVAEARSLARESLQKAQAGKNPVAEKREREQAARAGKLPDTFRAAALRYVERYAKKNTKPTTWQELRRQLDVDVFPQWGDRPIQSITRQDVSALLDGIADRGSPVQANRTLARLKTLFRWALDEELVTVDPAARVRKVIKETARDRVLSDDEIQLFWVGCDQLGWPFGPMFKLLLLTAQRRDEVGGMRWGELDLEKRIWTIPRERAKSDRAHVVHLSAPAVEIIEALPRTGELVFSTTGVTAVSGYSRAKERIDELMTAGLRQKSGNPEAEIAPWILHDLRRTATTGMAKLGIAPHVVDKVLNHSAGAIRGVAAVYNRHAYLEERKAALEAWGRYVESLIRPAPTNVVSLAAKSA